MSEHKTKEEIIAPALTWADLEGDEWEVASKGDILSAMEEYADQQTSLLTQQLSEKDKEIEELKLFSNQLSLDVTERIFQISEKDGEIERLKNRIQN